MPSRRILDLLNSIDATSASVWAASPITKAVITYIDDLCTEAKDNIFEKEQADYVDVACAKAVISAMTHLKTWINSLEANIKSRDTFLKENRSQ